MRFQVSGIVTGCRSLVSKKGNPFFLVSVSGSGFAVEAFSSSEVSEGTTVTLIVRIRREGFQNVATFSVGN